MHASANACHCPCMMLWTLPLSAPLPAAAAAMLLPPASSPHGAHARRAHALLHACHYPHAATPVPSLPPPAQARQRHRHPPASERHMGSARHHAAEHLGRRPQAGKIVTIFTQLRAHARSQVRATGGP
eukprot:353848-Chlamydomonas_euryale.AAC.6